jgi:gluconokinase
MGVSGSGKSSIGKMLAEALSVKFYDADDFHSQDSIVKMANGIPLTDDDRQPWLESMAHEMIEWNKRGGAVLACSALKEKYRQTLAGQLPDQVNYVYLKGDYALIKERLAARKGHFMGVALLDNQLSTLEEPINAIVVSIVDPPEKIVGSIVEKINNVGAPLKAI